VYGEPCSEYKSSKAENARAIDKKIKLIQVVIKSRESMDDGCSSRSVICNSYSVVTERERQPLRAALERIRLVHHGRFGNEGIPIRKAIERW
jgi:hypothetical protein